MLETSPPADPLSQNAVFLTITTRPSPTTLLALLLLLGGTFGWLRGRENGGSDPLPCDPADVSCVEGSTARPTTAAAQRSTLEADDFCSNVGYLCAGLASEDAVRLRRWKDFDGTLVVHVPLPDFVDSGTARSLQRAAAQGIRAWNNQPFAILTDLRGDRQPHFAVRWTTSLGGSQIGVARTQWSPATGLTVISIELVTQSPFNRGSNADPRQVRLTAAHEMGHALGLPHSDSSRDVMYPTNTALSMSAQDYRSIEVLYQIADGTTIRR